MARKKKTKSKYYGLDVSGMMYGFDTIKEAKKYFKNYPKGTYKIGKRKK